MQQTIKIFGKNREWLLIDAEVVDGLFGIHESLNNYFRKNQETKMFSVTVIPSGLSIFHSESYKKCKSFVNSVKKLDWSPVKVMMNDVGMHCSGVYCTEQAAGFDFKSYMEIKYRWID